MLSSTPRSAVYRALALILLLVLAAVGLSPAHAAPPGGEPYRPGIHFTPGQNWMNDPNGLVYYKGVYHLYYQYNPYGSGWGNMNWGHATSTDLMTWTEQPLALPETANEWMFSGSIVVDYNNTSGLGSIANPPLVALYTSAFHGHPVHGNRQMQSVAYSLDDGQSWTKYSGNPVLDRGSDHFRDPHVFWYDGGTTATRYWVMVAVEAQAHQVVIYKSSNLTSWSYLSTFGPANAVGGQWECPDLFELAVDGGATKKWVMVVNINPGGIAGGSGAQYFVGSFNGTTFSSESTYTGGSTLGVNVEDFGNYSGWAVNNTRAFASNGPFGTAPATGALAGQGAVTGNDSAFVNSFLGGDDPIGTMVSPSFTITDDFINLKVGGGNHPRAAGTGDGSPQPGYLTFNGLESAGTLQSQGWTVTAGATAMATSQPRTFADGGKGFIGDKLINTNGGFGDAATGTITSPTFTITKPHLGLLVGGGAESASLQARLLINGAVVRTTGGDGSATLNWRNWDVTQYIGNTTAQLQVYDQATGGWGHLLVDHMVNSDTVAVPRSTEATVNLVVNGQVVRTATGANSESLSWRNWAVTPYIGQQAQIVVSDFNSGGWGHILVDTVQLADVPQLNGAENYEWLDWGRDYYAAISFSNVPDNKRLMIGWMSNWDYAGDTPTSPWRNAMSLPREITLTQTAEGPRLKQVPVAQVAALAGAPSYSQGVSSVPAGSSLLPSGAFSQLARIDVTLRAGTAQRAGISVFGKNSTSTLIGYDATSGRLFVDRRNSGSPTVNALFPSIESTYVRPAANGDVAFSVYLDKASVEVFADGGKATITDIVFPASDANKIGVFAVGGTASIQSLVVTPLNASMYTNPSAPDGVALEPFNEYNGWSVNNTRAFASNGPFGTAPATGALAGQGAVTGNTGGFVNSFLGGDDPIGSMTSPYFTVTDDYINLKVGGGNHPRAVGTGDGSPQPGYLTFNGFESAGTLQSQGWTVVAGATAMATSQPRTFADGGKGFIGDKLINTHGGFGDAATGTITSPTFTITKPHLGLLVGGGVSSASLQVRLLVNGAVVRTTGGDGTGTLNWRNWDVTQYIGNTTAQLQVYDQSTALFGHLTVDHMVNSDTVAVPRSTETTVNLVVNGAIVRTATGGNSEALSWRNWNVTPYLGQQARLVIYDHASTGWGHILVDTVQIANNAQP